MARLFGRFAGGPAIKQKAPEQPAPKKVAAKAAKKRTRKRTK